jgi:hypothetical protein
MEPSAPSTPANLSSIARERVEERVGLGAATAATGWEDLVRPKLEKLD